jgi:RND family efflux transporter MFP subunit
MGMNGQLKGILGMKISLFRHCLVIGALAIAVPFLKAQEVIDAISEPSERLELSLPQVGVIAEIPVRDGDMVKAGQVIMKQDTELQRKQLESLMVEATSTLQTEAAKAELAAKQVVLARVEKMMAENAATQSELDEAKVAVQILEIKVRLTEEERGKKKIEADAHAVRIKQMEKLSPIDGTIESIEVGLGEVNDPAKPVCIVVKNDPLWVRFNLSSSQASALRLGEKLQVRYSDKDKWQEAEVIYLNPVVDARSDSRLVRLRLPNPTNKESGWQMQVQLPAKIANAGAAPRAGVE